MDIFPIIVVITFFQLAIIQKPFLQLNQTLFGILLVVMGLFIFILGLESALFPIGEKMANEFAIKGNPWWIIFFGFALGFSTTLAEPALIAVAYKASDITTGAISAWGLRISVALGVAAGMTLGVYRIVMGNPLHYYIAAGYVFFIIQTCFAPKQIIPLTYDSGGVTTSTVTVPLIAALGIGLASSVPGRSPLIDGFGLIAFASLFPMITEKLAKRKEIE